MIIGIRESLKNEYLVRTPKNIRVLSLWILFFEGIGVRVFDGILPSPVVVWTILLFLLNSQNTISLFRRYPLPLSMPFVIYLVFCSIKHVTPTYWIFAAWLSAYIVLSNYVQKPHLFLPDLFTLTRFSTVYSIVHIPIAIFLSDFLINTNIHMHPKTFLYLFYYNKVSGPWGFPRIQGFAWEPSCWNLLLNINLILSLYYKKKWSEISVSIVAICSCMSTTGLVVMIVALGGYLFLYSAQSKLKKRIFWVLPALLLLYPFVANDLSRKLSNTSGNTRYGDFAIMIAVIKESPVLGADLTKITKNSTAMKAREDAWIVEDNVDNSGYMNHSIVNGFASLFVEWGLLFALLHCFLFYKTPLINDSKFRKLFSLTFFCVLMGTPIVHTGFFYIYPFSSMMMYYRDWRYRSMLKTFLKRSGKLRTK